MYALSDLPILAFRRDEGDDEYLGYKLAEKEKEVYLEMDRASVSIAPDSDLDAYYKTIIPVGAEHGLGNRQAIAFWTRTTLSTFEP